MTYLFLGLSYLAGATPTSYWVGKLFHGIDLRQHGSGNLGATNAFRVLGWKWAVPVVAVDVAKGFVPVRVFSDLADSSFAWTLAFGAAALVGHVFSVWVGFRGGKGVATGAGVVLGLAPWAVLGAFVVWLVLLMATRYVSVASIGAALTLPALVLAMPDRSGRALLWFTLGLAAFVTWAHRSNLRRLMKGEERRIGVRNRSAPGVGT